MTQYFKNQNNVVVALNFRKHNDDSTIVDLVFFYNDEIECKYCYTDNLGVLSATKMLKENGYTLRYTDIENGDYKRSFFENIRDNF